jgi:translation initiation factor IF-2
MAITCPRCGAEYDVTLFQYGHRVRCRCGGWVDLRVGHVLTGPDNKKENPSMSEQVIGKVTHYFSKIRVAGIRLTEGTLHVGDKIHVVGHTTNFTQAVDSIQIENEAVEEAGVGAEIGIRVVDHAREHDVVYKVTGE